MIPADNHSVVKATDLSIGYLTGYKQTVVSAKINFSFGTGVFVCLIGPNGAGKSTLLRTMSGFQPVLEGKSEICGHSVNSVKPSELSKLLSIVLTDKPEGFKMTVFDVAATGCQPYTGFFGRLDPGHRKIVYQSLEQVGIRHLENRYFDELSDGEKQKTMIAKSLSQLTPVIILDEPAAFLDFPSKIDLMMLLRRLCSENNKTIIISTHDINLAFKMADEIMLLSPGKPFITGIPEELIYSGVIGGYFKRHDLFFDPLKLMFSQTIHYSKKAGLVGSELFKALASNLLQRHGFEIVDTENDIDINLFLKETGKNTMAMTYNGKIETFSGFQGLYAYLIAT